MEQLDLHIFILTQQIQFKALCQFLWDLGDKRLVLYSIWLDPGTLTRKLRNRDMIETHMGKCIDKLGPGWLCLPW